MNHAQATDRSSSRKHHRDGFFTSLLSPDDVSAASGLLEFQVVVTKLTQLLFTIALFLLLISITVDILKYEFGYIE